MSWWPFGRNRKPIASETLAEVFGVDYMEPPQAVRAWLAGLLRRYPFTPAARTEFGRWYCEAAAFGPADPRHDPAAGTPPDASDIRVLPPQRAILLRTARDAAGLYAVALAWWRLREAEPGRRDRFAEAVARLAAEPAARYAWAATIAGHYLHGVASAARPSAAGASYWQGQDVDADPGPIFAGLLAAIQADLWLLPDYAADCYAGLCERAGAK